MCRHTNWNQAFHKIIFRSTFFCCAVSHLLLPFSSPVYPILFPLPLYFFCSDIDISANGPKGPSHIDHRTLVQFFEIFQSHKSFTAFISNPILMDRYLFWFAPGSTRLFRNYLRWCPKKLPAHAQSLTIALNLLHLVCQSSWRCWRITMSCMDLQQLVCVPRMMDISRSLYSPHVPW